MYKKAQAMTIETIVSKADLAVLFEGIIYILEMVIWQLLYLLIGF